MSNNKKILFGDNFETGINDDIIEDPGSEGTAFLFSSTGIKFSSTQNTFDYES